MSDLDFHTSSSLKAKYDRTVALQMYGFLFVSWLQLYAD